MSEAHRKPTPTENPSAFLLGMIGTLYKNPQGYAETIGELDALLWQIHFLWGCIAGRNGDYVDTRCERYDEAFARKIRKIRSQPLSNEGARSMVIDLWKLIDSDLGVDTNPDQWDFADSSD